MILKSLSRKGGSGHFRQLYDYISREAAGDAIWRNFLYAEPGREQTVREFERNSDHLRKSPKYNILYHEILSIKRGAPDMFEMQVEALRTLAEKYLQQRAPNQLAFAAVHTNQKESVHLHMMISANDVGSNRRVCVPKFEFTKIQKELEQYLHERYPELNEPTIYNKPWRESERTNDKEQQLKKRTKAPSKKEQLKSLLQETFQRAVSKQQAQKALEAFGVKLEQRGKNMVAVQGKLRCRLKTLCLEQAYEEIGRKQAVNEQKQAASVNAKDAMDSLKKFWRERDQQERNQGRSR